MTSDLGLLEALCKISVFVCLVSTADVERVDASTLWLAFMQRSRCPFVGAILVDTMIQLMSEADLLVLVGIIMRPMLVLAKLDAR